VDEYRQTDVGWAAMGTIRLSTGLRGQTAAHSARACLFAGGFVLISALAAAQEAGQAPAAKPQESEGFLAVTKRWLGEQAATINSGFKDARDKVENFGREAGIAAKTTVDSAKDAADAVVRIPSARVVTGQEKCRLAANGAPDCVAAANDVCKGRGFSSGKSLDMTTAEICPPKVYMQGRRVSSEGCVTETFVSRALCQ
jgi:hypothetical protein